MWLLPALAVGQGFCQNHPGTSEIRRFLAGRLFRCFLGQRYGRLMASGGLKLSVKVPLEPHGVRGRRTGMCNQ